jgi:hypothetical protein
MLKYFSTAYIGTIGTILVHGVALICFVAFGLSTPDIKKPKPVAQEVEIALEDDFEMEEELASEDVSQPADPRNSDVRNAVVDANDQREKSMTDYVPFNESKVSEEIEKNLRGIEKQVIEERRASGKNLKEEYVGDTPENGGNSKTSQAGSSNGKSFAGTATVSFNLPGRKPRKELRAPAWNCVGGGTIVMKIDVDPIGNVIALEVDAAQSTANSCLQGYARTYAEREMFNRDESKPKRQSGTITYQFIAQ